MNRLITRAIAGAATASLALVGLAVGASAAEGQGAGASTITADSGSITVHKYTPGTTAGEPGNGLTPEAGGPAIPDGAQPIEGVTFTACALKDIDIKTNAGLQQAAELTKNGASAIPAEKIDTDNCTSATTDTDGIAAITDLPLGVYVVTESVTGEVQIKGEAEKTPASSVNQAAPFVVAIPMTHPVDRDTWMYDINVYPKNSVAGIKKAVVDTAAPGSGDTSEVGKSAITYTVVTEIPAVHGLNEYQIVDNLNAKLTYTGAQTDTIVVDGVTYDKGSDYTIYAVQADGSAPAEGTVTYVTVKFEVPGLIKLAAAKAKNPAANVTWTLHTDALDTQGYTEIPNKAHLIQKPDNEWTSGWNPAKPNTPTDPETPNPDPKNPPTTPKPPTTPPSDTPDIPGTPSNEVVTYYGKVELTKKAKDGKVLDGATFTLYQCDAEGTLEGDPITVDNKAEWVSGDGGVPGVVTIDGLLVNDFRNNSEFVNGKDGATWVDTSFYCLKETKAPEGYELLAQPIKFQVLKTDAQPARDYFVTAGESAFDVINVPANTGPKLPVTGAQGVALLGTAGVLLLAGSGALLVSAHRKRKDIE